MSPAAERTPAPSEQQGSQGVRQHLWSVAGGRLLAIRRDGLRADRQGALNECQNGMLAVDAADHEPPRPPESHQMAREAAAWGTK